LPGTAAQSGVKARTKIYLKEYKMMSSADVASRIPTNQQGPNINERFKKRAELRAQAEKLVNAATARGKDLEGLELKQYDAAVAELREVQTAIDDHARGAYSHSGAISTPTPTTQRAAFGMQLREAYARASQGERDQIDALGAILAGRPAPVFASADLRPSADGGVIIPSAVQVVMEHNYAAFAPVVSVARLFVTDDGEKTTFPVISDSESAVQLDAAAATGADATVSGDTPPTTITGPQLGAWKVSSKPVFIPRELIGDSPIDIVQEVIGALLARIIRFENLKYTKGAGTTEAEGFLTDATAYHAGAVALDLDIALDLAYSVPPLYRPNGVYMASDSTVKYLRKLHTGITGDKRALWKDAFEEGNATLGTPAKLHGYSVVINNDMDAVASDGTFASVSPLVFGDFSKFVVRQAENNSPYAYVYPVPAKDGRAAILFRRSDSKLVVPTAISKLIV
jgi:HK97 family phage major capsid protein